MTANRFNFRVWFKPNWQDHKMYYEAEQTYDSACEGKGSDCHYSFGDVLNDKDCIVMQSTGLRDKNCKEIYEGDIIKYKDTIRFINYNHQLGRLVASYINDINDYCDFNREWISKYEVIGNIYENKDILGE